MSGLHHGVDGPAVALDLQLPAAALVFRDDARDVRLWVGLHLGTKCDPSKMRIDLGIY